MNGWRRLSGRGMGRADRVGLGMLTWRRKDFEMPEEQLAYQVTLFPSLGLSFPFFKVSA